MLVCRLLLCARWRFAGSFATQVAVALGSSWLTRSGGGFGGRNAETVVMKERSKVAQESFEKERMSVNGCNYSNVILEGHRKEELKFDNTRRLAGS